MTETVSLRGFIAVLFRMFYRYVALVRCQGDMCVCVCVCMYVCLCVFFWNSMVMEVEVGYKTCVLRETKWWNVSVGRRLSEGACRKAPVGRRLSEGVCRKVSVERCLSEGVCRILNIASQLFASLIIWTICGNCCWKSLCYVNHLCSNWYLCGKNFQFNIWSSR
jgi:hypothetical protein